MANLNIEELVSGLLEAALTAQNISERQHINSLRNYFDDKGNPKGMKMMNSTITKWLRICIDGDTSDKFLKTLTLKDRTDIFVKMQEYLLVGEEKASK